MAVQPLQVECQNAAIRADSTGGLHRQITHSDQISLAQARHRLHPAEDFLHAFALRLAHAVAGTARRACVDGAAAMGVVLCHMRRQIQLLSR